MSHNKVDEQKLESHTFSVKWQIKLVIIRTFIRMTSNHNMRDNDNIKENMVEKRIFQFKI